MRSAHSIIDRDADLTGDKPVQLSGTSKYSLAKKYGLILRLKKRRVQTTDSTHPYPRYPDLAKGLVPMQGGGVTGGRYYLCKAMGWALLFPFVDNGRLLPSDNGLEVLHKSVYAEGMNKMDKERDPAPGRRPSLCSFRQ